MLGPGPQWPPSASLGRCATTLLPWLGQASTVVDRRRQASTSMDRLGTTGANAAASLTAPAVPAASRLVPRGQHSALSHTGLADLPAAVSRVARGHDSNKHDDMLPTVSRPLFLGPTRVCQTLTPMPPLTTHHLPPLATHHSQPSSNTSSPPSPISQYPPILTHTGCCP
jgi:hypothetical protein